MTVKVIGPLAPPPAGARLVLWALPAQGAPFVLGDVPASGSASSDLPGTSEQLLSKVTKLAVTLESVPAPATPGPIVYAGNCAKLW
jgi:anti-sigma-K factor RskA